MSKDLAKEVVRKKSVHVEMPKDVHMQLRITLFKNGNLPIQAVFAEVAERIGLEDPYMMKLLSDLREKRENRQIRSITETDAEELFSIMERESPFSPDTQE